MFTYNSGKRHFEYTGESVPGVCRYRVILVCFFGGLVLFASFCCRFSCRCVFP